MKIAKTLHVKFFLIGSLVPARSVCVLKKYKLTVLPTNCLTERQSRYMNPNLQKVVDGHLITQYLNKKVKNFSYGLENLFQSGQY